jgi:hypothetical protein
MLSHPDVQRPWSNWSEDQTLHVAAAYSNPFRWRTRRELANNFRRHMAASPNVVLHMGELAYGDRPHEVTGDYAGDVQLRTQSELFHKENIQNRIIQSFPTGWKYGCTVDADFHFTRHDWALETIHQLQHYDFVQPFSSYADLSGGIYGQAQLPVRYNSGFFFNYVQNGYTVSKQYHNGKVPNGITDADGYEGSMLVRGVGATGGALAFRRSAFDAVGGLLDRCILGHADWYMAFSLLGIEPPDIHTQKYHQTYKDYVNAWRERAQVIKKNVGYVDGHAMHFFHGSKTRRAYSSRDVILAQHQYAPYVDVFADSQGIYQMAPNKPDFRDAIRRYFLSRFEDDPNLYGSEKPLV